MIRVALADDQPLVRAGFRMLLDAEEDIAVVGEADDGAAAHEVARATRPDVMLMDDRMPDVDGLEATRRIVDAGTVAGFIGPNAEALTWVAARLLAPTQDVATNQWVGLPSLEQGLTDYGKVMFWVTGYAVLAMALGVLVRSVPVALAVGIAWAGPLEHLVQEAWGPATRLFPGLLLEAFVAGGTPEVSALRASLTVTAYAAAAALVAGTVFARRDVTA